MFPDSHSSLIMTTQDIHTCPRVICAPALMAARNRHSQSSEESKSFVFPSLSQLSSIHLRTDGVHSLMDGVPGEPSYTEAMVGSCRKVSDVYCRALAITKAMQDSRNGLEYTRVEASSQIQKAGPAERLSYIIYVG